MKALVLFVSIFAAAAATDYEDCGSTAGDIQLEIPQCDFYPCEMPINTDQSLTLSFKPSGPVETLSVTFLADDNLGAGWQQWNGIPPDVCANLSQGECPAAAGDQLSTTFNLHIANFPLISVWVQMKIVDDTGASQVCAQFEVEIIEG